MNITPAAARKEIARRAARKGTAKRNARPSAEIMRLTGPELHAIAGAAPAVHAPAAKPAKVRTPEMDLRKLAWEMRNEAKVAGERLTYAEACALVGVTPARASA